MNEYLEKSNSNLQRLRSEAVLEANKNEKIIDAVKWIVKGDYRILAIDSTKSTYHYPEEVILYGYNDDDIQIMVTSPNRNYKYLTINTNLNLLNKTIFIEDIECSENNVNKGYGSLAMDCLINIAKSRKIERIRGRLSSVDKDHFDRLQHFYSKFGFSVNMDTGLIELVLK